MMLLFILILNTEFVKVQFWFLLESCKMANSAVVTPDAFHDKTSCFQLVTWINSLLKTDFKDVQEMGSGDSSA